MDTGRDLYKLHSKFCYNAKDQEELSCMVIEWEPPVCTFLKDGNDPLVYVQNQKLRMSPKTQELCAWHASATIAHGHIGNDFTDVS